jgi:hypothetical protein
LLQAKLLERSTLKIYPGFPHGMFTTHADVINPDLPAAGLHMLLLFLPKSIPRSTILFPPNHQ